MTGTADRLRRVARDYELRARAADDQAVAGDEQQRDLARVWSLTELVLLELAEAIEAKEREAA